MSRFMIPACINMPLCNLLGLVCHGFLGFESGVELEVLEMLVLISFFMIET